MKQEHLYISGDHVDLELLEFVRMPLKKQCRPYYIFSILVQKNEVGRLVFRLGSDKDHEFSGHIGYTIEEAYRGHHYAYEACRTLIPFMKKMGYHHVIITCDPTNIASRKTIEKLPVHYLGTKPIPRHLRKQYEKHEIEKRIYQFELEE